MTNKSEWQEANRRLTAEQRQTLGDPPAAEEMLAYSRGELSESEEERIRELLVAHPELARMYGAPVPEGPQAGEPDAVSENDLLAGWSDLRRRLGGLAPSRPERDRRADSQRGRVLFRHIPATVAAALALVFFGLFVQAEGRARQYARDARIPRMLGAPQELIPDSSRGVGAPTMLRRDGEAYWLRLTPLLLMRHRHYLIELNDEKGVIWTKHAVQPDARNVFQIVIPHDFLRSGTRYQLRIYGVDGEQRTPAGVYDVAVPSE